MSLRTSYTLLAPIYDRMVAAATQAARRASLARLPADARQVLLVGAGTGLDFPLLPAGPQYTAIDLTPAMLDRARQRAAARPEVAIELRSGDALALDFADASFDAVILHLIVAVVPDAARALAESARVLRPGGRVLLYDKFLRPGQSAPLRRLLSPLLGRIASRTDVVLEHHLPPTLRVLEDEASLAGGWFRRVLLERV
ncbi:MAG TPA: class I SAM-dependent methyltransferase [Plasticicumulans sp.]|uniref:class I SAM-dependent methyltransferase n=2 Tax=Plasticicumulans sp. TaxID=2307179 RepID=UPI002CF2B9F6|nr:class I SAM-dependent methyltransferase [Plasticicumulans sp.]HNF65976.1 class I SAM-dependent methyltransferase [Plasticicumulans sp.]HNG50123.1 class I SAM-dependent methyltransferase [Plasticicumulans sp.]